MRIAILTLAALSLAVGGAAAAIYFVDAAGTGDYATIQAAVNAVSANSIIELAEGTYTGAGNRDIDFLGKALTIRSASGRPASCVIDCQGAGRGFNFHTAETGASVVKGLTVRNGYAADYGGGVYCSGASPSILNCVIADCEAEVRGGGIYGVNAQPTVNNCVISGNTAQYGGGVAYWSQGGHFWNDLFTGNSADYGDAVYLSGPDIYVRSCTFDTNYGRNYDSALYGASGGGFTITNSIVWNNDGYPMIRNAVVSYSCIYGDGFSGTGNIDANPQFASGPAGGWYLATTSPCVSTGSAAASAVAFTAGDGTVAMSRLTTRADETNDSGTVDMGYHHGHANIIYVPDRYGTIQAALDNAFSGERVVVRDGNYYERVDFHGRAIELASEHGVSVTRIGGTGAGSTVTFAAQEGRGSILQGFTVSGGVANTGGGIYVDSTAPSIRLCHIAANQATNSGGGVGGAFSRLSLQNTEVVLNTAGSGGGIWIGGAGSKPSLSYVSLEKNAADHGGGASFAWASVTMDHCLVVHNTADEGGGIDAYGTHLEVANCTLVDNFASVGSGEGILFDTGTLDLVNTIIAFNHGWDTAAAVACVSSVTVTASCCDIYGNAGGDWTDCLAGLDGADCNFSLDPLFCGVLGETYGLHANSMCAPAMNPGCGSIGFTTATCAPEIYTVRADGTGEYPTLQAAIDAAFDGIIVQVAAGTYTGTGNRDLDFKGKAITVESESGDPADTIIDCQGSTTDPHRGLFFHTGEDSTSVLRNVTIRGGRTSTSGSGAGLYCVGGSGPKVEGCVFFQNGASDGGGIYCYQSDPIVVSCSFTDCTASNAGGAIAAHTATPEVRGCTFSSNWAYWGGGVLSDYRAGTRLYNCEIRSNSTNNLGGAILTSESVSRTEARNCIFHNNASGEQGGAIYGRNGSIITVSGCTFMDNTATTGGTIRLFNAAAGNFTNSIVWAQAGYTNPVVALQTSAAASFACCDVRGGLAGIVKDGSSTVAWGAGNLDADPQFCGASQGFLGLRSTSPCAERNNPGCGLIGADERVCSATGVDDDSPPAPAPAGVRLLAAAPNPFNPRTTIRFELPAAGTVRLAVHGLDGRLVATLVSGELPAGEHEAVWDGRDRAGRPAASGVYICRLEAGGVVRAQRVALLK